MTKDRSGVDNTTVGRTLVPWQGKKIKLNFRNKHVDWNLKIKNAKKIVRIMNKQDIPPTHACSCHTADGDQSDGCRLLLVAESTGLFLFIV